MNPFHCFKRAKKPTATDAALTRIKQLSEQSEMYQSAMNRYYNDMSIWAAKYDKLSEDTALKITALEQRLSKQTRKLQAMIERF